MEPISVHQLHPVRVLHLEIGKVRYPRMLCMHATLV